MSKFLPSLLGAFRGGVHPREIGLAVFLGVLAGFVSGWNLSLAAVLLAALVLRTPWKMFGQAWAVAAAVAWALTPVTFRVGHFLLADSPLGGWLAPHADGPWVALFDLDRYTLVGGVLLAPIVALPTAWIIAAVTRGVQDRLVALQEKMSANQHWQARFGTRMVCWLLFGETELATAAPQVGWVRKAGLAATVLAIIPAAVSGWLYLPTMLESGLLRGMSLANQAEVTAERCELRLAEGLLEIEGLQIADPRNLDRDRLRIERLTADLKPGPLLRGRLHVETLAVSGLNGDVPRDRPARPCKLELPDFGRDDKSEPRDGRSAGDDWGFGLSEYAKDWRQIEGRLQQVRGLLEQIEHVATKCRALSGEQKPEPPEKGHDLMGPAYAHLRAMRYGFGRPQPSIWIEDIRAAKFAAGWGLGDSAKLQLNDVSSEPELTQRPVKLRVEADGGAVLLAATFNVHRPGTPHDVGFEARDVALERLVDTSRLSHTFAIQAGKLHFSGLGTMTSRQVDMPMAVGLRDLNVRLLGEQKIAGLSPDLWNQGLSKLGGLEVQSRLTGRWSAPRLQVNTRDLAEQFQAQLRAAGHAVLAQAVEGQLARGQQAVAQAVDQATSKAQDAIAQQRANVDAAIGAGQHQVSRAADAVQQHGAAAQQGIAAVQNQMNSGTNQAAGAAQQQIDQAGAAAKQWLGGHNPLPSFGAPLPGGNPFAQGPAGIIDAATGQAHQQIEAGRQATGQAADGAAGAAQAPVSQIVDNSAAVNQAAQDAAAQARAHTQATQDGATGALNAGAAQTNGLAAQAAQAVRDALPGQPSPQATNTPAAVGPYTEVAPGSSANGGPFALPAGPAADPRGENAAPAGQDNSAAPPVNYPPPVQQTPGVAPPTDYPMYDAPATDRNAAQHSDALPEHSQAAPPGGAYDNNGFHGPTYSPPAPGNVPAGPDHGAGPDYSPYPNHTGQPDYPPMQRHPAAQADYAPDAQHRAPPPYAAGPRPGYPPPQGNEMMPPRQSVPQRPRSDFYTDENEAPAYEAGGRYELEQPPQGPPPYYPNQPWAPGGAPQTNPWQPQVPAWQQGAPYQGPAGAAPNFGPAPNAYPGEQSPPDQAGEAWRRLPVALRGQQAEAQAQSRQGPLPVALRGRQMYGGPPASPQPAADDEWQITRWARDTGTGIKSFIFGDDEPPPQPRPPMYPGAPQQPPAGPAQSYAGPPNYGQPSLPAYPDPGLQGGMNDPRFDDSRGYHLMEPHAQGMAAQGPYQPPVAPGAPPVSPAPQTAKEPWYKFW